MSMSDPIADMLARIKNAQGVSKRSVSMPSSKVKVAIAGVLKDEGYIRDFQVEEDGAKRVLTIELKYVDGRGVIDRLERYSRPSRRRYFGKDDLPRVLNGLGVAIVSTSHGVMTDTQARAQGHGGEVLCLVA
jgi:small subunit ribosomal protein S8